MFRNGLKFLPPERQAPPPMLHSGFPLELRAVADYLLWARDAEEQAWFRDDYQIALRTCLNLGKGYPNPFVLACRETLGLHPDKVWPAMIARKRWLLGTTFREGVDDVTWHPHWELIAKWELRQKPSGSVKFLPRKIA